MTNAIAHFRDIPLTLDSRTTGLSRVVARLSLAMLAWVAKREERIMTTASEQQLIVFEARSRALREYQSLARYYRFK